MSAIEETGKGWAEDELKTYSFKDLLSNIVDNRGRTCPVVEKGFPLIKTSSVKNGTLYPVLEDLRYVDGETYASWFRGHPEPNDIIFVTKGNAGQTNLTPDPVNFCIAQDMLAIRANEEVVDPKFLFALLREKSTAHAIQQMHVGSLIPHFKKGDFDKLYFKIPQNTGTQKEIGKTYFALTNKIQLLREQNETLEALAQTLFKRWFIDFNFPDENGKPYRDSGGAMVASELGEIPAGWHKTPLYDLAKYINGSAFKPVHFSKDGSGLAVIKIAELKSGLSNQTKFCAEEMSKKILIKSGDVLFSWSGSPETSIDAFIWVGDDALLNQHIFKVTDFRLGKGTTYFLLKYLKPLFINIAKQKQTTGLGHVTVADLKEQSLAIPEADDSLDYTMFEGLFEKLLSNTQQIETLTQLRNTLLPKLMKGEIRVPVEP